MEDRVSLPRLMSFYNVFLGAYNGAETAQPSRTTVMHEYEEGRR
jgi:hypothetical protein